MLEWTLSIGQCSNCFGLVRWKTLGAMIFNEKENINEHILVVLTNNTFNGVWWTKLRDIQPIQPFSILAYFLAPLPLLHFVWDLTSYYSFNKLQGVSISFIYMSGLIYILRFGPYIQIIDNLPHKWYWNFIFSSWFTCNLDIKLCCN